MKKLLIVVGTRPNFIKITQFKRVAESKFPEEFNIKIVHTGQHYDDNMAQVFFKQFNLIPDFFLDISPTSPNKQMAEVMIRLENVIKNIEPDLIIVVGDVNSTFAATLTANKLKIKVAHVESGLRSFDRSMPEEINRILTDEIADYLFITEKSGRNNLLKEGKKESQIYFVGNTMIDTMIAYQNEISTSNIMERIGLEKGKFLLMTMHRPATVDNKSGLLKLGKLIEEIAVRHPIVFPIHPRTVQKLKKHQLYEKYRKISGLILTNPMEYFAFQNLISNCMLILTDSGGIQEESTFRHVPCLTLRANTERPSTIESGTNLLIPFDNSIINKTINDIKSGDFKNGMIPPKWDGKATERILGVLANEV